MKEKIQQEIEPADVAERKLYPYPDAREEIDRLNEQLRRNHLAWQHSISDEEAHVENEALKARLNALEKAITPLLVEVCTLRDTLHESSLEAEMQVAEGWNALIKIVEKALKP